jgi:hypothetical protein
MIQRCVYWIFGIFRQNWNFCASSFLNSRAQIECVALLTVYLIVRLQVSISNPWRIFFGICVPIIIQKLYFWAVFAFYSFQFPSWFLLTLKYIFLHVCWVENLRNSENLQTEN